MVVVVWYPSWFSSSLTCLVFSFLLCLIQGPLFWPGDSLFCCLTRMFRCTHPTNSKTRWHYHTIKSMRSTYKKSRSRRRWCTRRRRCTFLIMRMLWHTYARWNRWAPPCPAPISESPPWASPLRWHTQRTTNQQEGRVHQSLAEAPSGTLCTRIAFHKTMLSTDAGTRDFFQGASLGSEHAAVDDSEKVFTIPKNMKKPRMVELDADIMSFQYCRVSGITHVT